MTLSSPTPPVDAAARRGVKPVVVYPVETLPKPDITVLEAIRQTIVRRNEVIVPPRDARTFRVKRGQFFRIVCMEGAQVGDLNLWNSNDLTERFFSGKTRALHSTHVSTGDRLWSTMPHLRSMATISHDTLGWYGWDEDGAGVHDVIGTRCDPYTKRLLSGSDYDRCCHSNLARALATELGDTPGAVEHHIHDVLNVFMCTGFTKDTHQYFMKASPVRAGDFIEFFAEIDLLGALSACPGGDCSTTHSSDVAACHPLKIEIFEPYPDAIAHWSWPSPSAYHRGHGALGKEASTRGRSGGVPPSDGA